jgi:hypothetical protein
MACSVDIEVMAPVGGSAEFGQPGGGCRKEKDPRQIGPRAGGLSKAV